ncbi:MAG: hypothetical protein JXM79_13830 [Sedimentisphaerales bacterium]|nr:hypothetical protein [Sedimentisphaerales bacterium]
MFGQLKIVPSADLGEMGPQQGDAIRVNWKWYYSALRLVIWLVVMIAFVIPKTNRNIRIILIFVPLAVVNILWSIFMTFAKMNSTDALEFGLIFNSMAVSVTVLWLVAHSFVRFKGAIRFLLFFVTVSIPACLGPLSYYTEFSNETAMFSALFVFLALTLLIACTLSRRFCKGTYRPVRFVLWLALWIFICSMLAMMGFIIVGSIIFPSRPTFFEAIWILLLAGLMCSLFLYFLNLPYFILGFIHPFYRERFCACLNLKTRNLEKNRKKM